MTRKSVLSRTFLTTGVQVLGDGKRVPELTLSGRAGPATPASPVKPVTGVDNR